jgi:hypothetical protein
MKLLYILFESLYESKIIKVPQNILDLAEKEYSYITSNIESFKDRASDNFKKPYIPSKFNNIFKLKDLKNNAFQVSIGFYDNPKDPGAGRMNTYDDILLINLSNPPTKEEFMEIIEHELVHAMDPKVRDMHLLSREYAKKGAEPTGSKLQLSKSDPNAPTQYSMNMDKYYKSPWEFDSFSSTMINKLKKSYDKVGDKKAFKDSMKELLSAIKSKSPENILNSDLINTAWYFFPDTWEPDKWGAVQNNFLYDLKVLKSWSSKPTLYKRFLQRFANEVL